ncbi:hypothetical protein [Acaryochloris marina]|uniref:hypothetical protein n=1 Tax=Acaryochloris marina TaxID=155978 RepID=UPI001BAE831E|nr:hypothetical protein [Acaryochloris marina]QUY46286.1 hypothetical protein I1H34_31795 [Acaryochloris marina S15]
MKLTQIKQAVIANFAQQHNVSVTNIAELKQAAKQLWPEQTYNFRKAQIWLNFAKDLQVDIVDYIAPTSKDEQKLSDLKAEVCQHYEVKDTKTLKAKLKSWGISHGKLSTRKAWEELLEGCKASPKGQVIELPADPLGVAA